MKDQQFKKERAEYISRSFFLEKLVNFKTIGMTWIYWIDLSLRLI